MDNLHPLPLGSAKIFKIKGDTRRQSQNLDYAGLAGKIFETKALGASFWLRS
jgi:hypothetical protein